MVEQWRCSRVGVKKVKVALMEEGRCYGLVF